MKSPTVKELQKTVEETEKILHIEQGIPIPPKLGMGGALGNTLRAMKVGDSIVVSQRQRNAAFALVHKTGVKLASRRMNDTGDQIRLWRIK